MLCINEYNHSVIQVHGFEWKGSLIIYDLSDSNVLFQALNCEYKIVLILKIRKLNKQNCVDIEKERAKQKIYNDE